MHALVDPIALNINVVQSQLTCLQALMFQRLCLLHSRQPVSMPQGVHSCLVYKSKCQRWLIPSFNMDDVSSWNVQRVNAP